MIKHLASIIIDSVCIEILRKNGDIYAANFDDDELEFMELEELCRNCIDDAEEYFEIKFHDDDFEKEYNKMRKECIEKY